MVAPAGERAYIATTAVDATTEYDSVPIVQVVALCVHARWTKTAVTGTVALEGSVDNAAWFTVDSADASAVDFKVFEDYPAAYKFFRVKVTVGSGELTTLNVGWSGK